MDKTLITHIEKLISVNKNLFLGISGVSCAGKTYLSNEIQTEFERRGYSVAIIHQDDFLKNLDYIQAHDFNCEEPDSFHIPTLIQSIQQLDISGFTEYFKYDLQSNTRTNKLIPVVKSQINVIEGLHAIDILNRCLLKTKIFTVYLDINKDETRKRRIKRDAIICNVAPELISSIYDTVLMQYKPYETQKNYADLILN